MVDYMLRFVWLIGLHMSLQLIDTFVKLTE